MRGMWKRSYGRATKAPPDERGGNRHAQPTATAPHPDSTLLSRSKPSARRSEMVKGFGCRPVVTYPRALRAGVRKPPRKEPAGVGRQLAVYGDLTMRRLALWMRWPAQSAADRRLRWRASGQGGVERRRALSSR